MLVDSPLPEVEGDGGRDVERSLFSREDFLMEIWLLVNSNSVLMVVVGKDGDGDGDDSKDLLLDMDRDNGNAVVMVTAVGFLIMIPGILDFLMEWF